MTNNKKEPIFSVLAVNNFGVVLMSLNSCATFVEWVAALLKVSPNTPITTLEKLIKICNYFMTFEQAGEMIKTVEPKSNIAMCADVFSNFFFMKNEDDSISVGCLPRDERDHMSNVYRFSNKTPWSPGNRLLVRDFDIGKLDLANVQKLGLIAPEDDSS